MNFENKKFLILGSNGLIANALGRALAEKGPSLILVDQHEIKENCVKYQKSEYYRLDVTKLHELQKFIYKMDQVDGVINLSYPKNSNYGKSALLVNPDDFNENVSMMLGSTFALMQSLAIRFKNNNKPVSIINVASVYGVVAPKFDIYKDSNFTMPAEYAAAKSAIIQITKYFSKYVGSSKFRVNCVSPGGVFDNHQNGFVKQYSKYTVAEKMLEPVDLVGIMMFLLSDYSKNINGQNIIIDDGFTL